MIKRIIALAVIFVMPLITIAQLPLKLWYNTPAKTWTQALPTGNGRLGTMVYGNPATEHIQLNENTIWAGGPHRTDNPSIADSLQYLRQLIFDDKFAEAEDVAVRNITSKTSQGMPYQTAGNLLLLFDGHESYTNYYRQLSLDSAVAYTTYRVGSVQYKREMFTSFTDGVIVIRLTANKANAISFLATLNRPEKTKTSIAGNNIIKMTGITSSHEGVPGKVQYEVLAKVITDAGAITPTDTALKIEKANSVTIFISIATNFKKYNDISANAHKKAMLHLNAASQKSYTHLLQKHVAFYKKYFNRVHLNLGVTAAAAKTTNERIKEFSASNDPQLLTLYFQFGRYLLISSSQPGGQPANLQGLWNNQLYPSWDSKYTININTEMNYWPAEVTNLGEMHEPLINMVKDLAVTGVQTAKNMYNAKGWVAHHNTDLWRFTGAIDGSPGLWPCGGAWLSQHLWDKYMFAGNKKYLHSVYNQLRSAARFFLDFLVEEPINKWLVVSPSMSPENAPYMIRKQWKVITAGTTFDNQLVFDLFSNTMQAAKILQTDTLFADSLQRAIAKLPPMHIGKFGQLQEWLQDWDNPNDNHRHISHLYGLYPSNQISPFRTPALWHAARTSLIHRGDKSTGWSMNWKINLWARLLDGDHAFKLMKEQISLVEDNDESVVDYEGKGGTYPNMFDAHPPFQIDGNFGFTAGIAEMLLQSHDGAIHVLPALPTNLPNGQINGLKARGGFEVVSLKWKYGKVEKLIIKSTIGGNCRIRSYWPLHCNKNMKQVVDDNSENLNPFYKIPVIKTPIIASHIKIDEVPLKKVYQYDVATKAGEVISFWE